MGNFTITADNFCWITGAADDPEDLCLHGDVTVTIGDRMLTSPGTVSATALYLLKSLTEDHFPDRHELQMIPCCGHFLVANADLTEVTIIGCDTGLDWAIRHENDSVHLTAPDGTETVVTLDEYRAEVFGFVDAVEQYYRICTPKRIPTDEFDRNGYTAFWNEWHRRRAAAAQ